MPITLKDLIGLRAKLPEGALAGVAQDAQKAQMAPQMQMLQQQAAEDKQLRELRALEELKQIQPGAQKYDMGDLSVSMADPNGGLKLLLTPAQEAAEKTYGKQLTDYETSGGRGAMEKNVAELEKVKQYLGPEGERGPWQRGVGTLFGTSPSIMGMLSSTEKAMRDKARSTALTIAKQTDPNPTEKQIEAIMGQIYDPASSNEDNAARIESFLDQTRKKAVDMESAAQRYKQTGYATMSPPKGRFQQPSAPSTGPHGATVEQDGKTYRWNPRTQNYE